MNVRWNVFDQDAEIELSTRNLPHWDQVGALTFVTLRLADSMPRKVVKQWQNEIDLWMVEHGLGGRSVEDVFDDPNTATDTIRSLIRYGA